ncbi:MAG: hypothetical protein JOZ25_00370 [Actinobacteria bacterium]|nr:hypothetical protein [Actinomycetota bacterium]
MRNPGTGKVARGARELGAEAGHVAREAASAVEHELASMRLEEPYWPAQLAVAAALLLYLVLPETLTIGPRWLLPALEGGLLLGLTVTTPHRHHQESRRRRVVAIGLIALVSATNAVALGLLAHYLLKGGKANGHTLILSGAVIWLTNVILFGLWYWELDRGGPGRRLHPEEQGLPDFLFPQMSDPSLCAPGWKPSFIDYIYVSFTNATAFSPTDTMPLTGMAKGLMSFQALVSLVTIGLVVSRAVNILS